MPTYTYVPPTEAPEPQLEDFTDDGHSPDASEAEDIHEAVDKADDAGQIDSDDAERLHGHMNEVVEQKNEPNDDWPTENMDEEDTPFGTGD